MFKLKNKAQSLGEYVVMATIVVAAVAMMFPMVKRGTQSLIKAGADQIGVQRNSEQDFNADSGYTEYFYSNTRANSQKDTFMAMNKTMWARNVRTVEETVSLTNSLTNMGFTKDE
ncbi:MAG: hypothetical protein HQL20_01315 [Candidatus Omnitrophica bacterium]|nr:hypothetical protein [Candidatus Omnitrophota bacterium]